MQVPLSYADAVIGAAGASISYIRRHSGATISIQEGAPGEMTVEITGSASQVQTAQQLIKVFFCLKLHQQFSSHDMTIYFLASDIVAIHSSDATSRTGPRLLLGH
jgi:hypothetical protein